LPSDEHERLYGKLREVISAARAALAENDFWKLRRINETHRIVMEQLLKTGDCRDTRLLQMITRIREEALGIEKEIDGKLTEVRKRLKSATNRTRIASAYASAHDAQV